MKPLRVGCGSAFLEERLKRWKVWGASFSYSFFETINVLTRSHTANQTIADKDLDGNINVNHWTIKFKDTCALCYSASSFSTLEFLEEPKYDTFCLFILATKSSNSSSGFYAGKERLLCRRHLILRRLQLISPSNSLWGTLYTMAYHPKLAAHPSVTRMHTTLYSRTTINPNFL